VAEVFANDRIAHKSPFAKGQTISEAPPTKTKPPSEPKEPLQVRWPKSEVKAVKLAALKADFATVSDFMLACFHAYMQKSKLSEGEK
jgi:hypothetical protein